MVISQIDAENAARALGLGKDLSDFQNDKLSYSMFMERITAKRKTGKTVDVQNANRLEEFVIGQE